MSGLADFLRLGMASVRQDRAFRMVDLPHKVEGIAQLGAKEGWLTACGNASSIVCDLCDKPHRADLYKIAENRFAYDCLFNGPVEIAEAELMQYRFDAEALLSSIARAAGIPTKAFVPHCGGQFFRLGIVSDERVADGGWTLGLLLEDGDMLDWPDFLRTLDKAYPRGPGIILSIDPTICRESLPHGLRAVPLEEVISPDESGLRFRGNRIDSELGIAHGARKRGAKSKTPFIAEIMHSALEAKKWPSVREDQKKFILENWDKKKFGHMPKASSLDRNIREARNLIAEG